MDNNLSRRATAAWERHNAAPRISGGPDGLRREFIAGYCARENEDYCDACGEPIASEGDLLCPEQHPRRFVTMDVTS